MAAKFFGQFLLEKGLLSPEQLLRALELQRASNPLLGEIAQALGLLSAAQASRINDQQKREDRRFGDIAIELGLLDAGQLDALLAEQKKRRRLFGEILLAEGMIDAARLEAELALHQADRQQAVKALELGLASHPRGETAATAIDIACRLFQRVLKVPCQFSSLLGDTDALPADGVSARVGIHGERSVSLAIATDPDTLYGIARGFLGSNAADHDLELARDALGELLNIIMGYVVRSLLPADAQYRASPPQHGSADAVRTPGSVGVWLTSPLGAVVLAID